MEETPSAISGPSKVLSETVSAADTKSLSVSDQFPVSSLETLTEGLQYLPHIDILPVHEAEIQVIPQETVGLYAHSSGTLETISYRNEWILRPEHEIEFEPEESYESFKQSVEPSAPAAGLELVLSNEIAVTPFPPGEYQIPTDENQFEFGLDVKGSTRRTLLKIFNHMSDVTVSTMGVHGMGGIGKSTLLKALFNHPKTKSMFDFVILVNISRYWSTRKIQNEVLRQLLLNCEDSETDSQVADRIFQILEGKKFLLLLDDVWEQIDLRAVGIPHPSSENGCKILMASRKLDVCRNVDVSEIEVETLSIEEAWELFNEKVGGIIDSSKIPFARDIVKGCNGLPLLIIVTGSALYKENDDSVWELASMNFSQLSAVGAHHTEDVVQLLKFSFDRLKDHDIKSCFLHCVLFREDQEVNILELIEYCIWEGIITGTRADAYKRGYDIVDYLVHASMLQLNGGGHSVKMHGLIRDLALSILFSTVEDSQFPLRAPGSQFLLPAYSRLMEPSSPESNTSSTSLRSPENSRLFIPEAHQFLLTAGAGLTEPPLEEEWRQARMAVLMHNDLRTLPDKPNCPELSAFYVQRNSRLRAIPMSFFSFMTSLKLLNLSKIRIKSLPKTLSELKKLHMLILRDCERLAMLPSEIGSLETLEVIDLRGTEISKLPKEIGGLASLLQLEVSLYGSINYSEQVKLPRELIPSGIISNLQVLKILSIVVYPGDKRWYEVVESVINEVSSLKTLRSLCFHFPEIRHLNLFLEKCESWKSGHLREFKFVVGHHVKSIVSRVPNYIEFDYNQHGQCLRFVNCVKSNTICEVLARSAAFHLDHHLEVCSLSDFELRNINELKYCIISECPNIETVVGGNETVFPCLENLSIHYLWKLTSIWKENSIVPEGSFAALRFLTVHACQGLKYVFRSSLAQRMSKLEELTVEDCEAIKEIISEDEIIDTSQAALPGLKKLTLHYLPELSKIWTGPWPSLELISFYDCPMLKKIGMDSYLTDTGKEIEAKNWWVELKEIKAEKNWWGGLEWEDTAMDMRSHLQNCLTEISEEDE